MHAIFGLNTNIVYIVPLKVWSTRPEGRGYVVWYGMASEVQSKQMFPGPGWLWPESNCLFPNRFHAKTMKLKAHVWFVHLSGFPFSTQAFQQGYIFFSTSDTVVFAFVSQSLAFQTYCRIHESPSFSLPFIFGPVHVHLDMVFSLPFHGLAGNALCTMWNLPALWVHCIREYCLIPD